MSSLLSLAKLFAEYRIYPADRFESSTAHIFQQEFKDDHYARNLGEFLNLQLLDRETSSVRHRELQRSIEKAVEKERFEWITLRVDEDGSIEEES